MEKIKSINKFEDLVKIININKKDKPYFDEFFKRKFIHIKDKKIIYPEIKEIKKVKKELKKKLRKLKELKKVWTKKKKDAENYHKNIDEKKIITKKYWKHKLKQIINKEYKQDCIDAKLSDHILMDPEYENLFNTFLKDPDYRKKLKETINNSIIYNNKKIGEYSKNKQKFKLNIANNKILEIEKDIQNTKFKIDTYNKILNTIIKNK